jgi:hypothetical protein
MIKNYNKVVIDRGMAYFYNDDELIFRKLIFDVFKSYVDCDILYLEGPHNDMSSLKKLTIRK